MCEKCNGTGYQLYDGAQGELCLECKGSGKVVKMKDEILCPYCLSENDSHAAQDGRSTPGPGDVALCFSCGNFNVYCVNDFNLLDSRAPNDKEMEYLTTDPGTVRVKKLWEETKKNSKSAKGPDLLRSWRSEN